MSKANKKKIINDPVYGFINIRNEEIYDLIQHPYFQRLRRIKQLGLTNLVYPGAEHTRFAHSIGAMHLMTQALDVLRAKGVSIDEEEYNAALIAILLHDIGHSPLSHSLEHCFFTSKHEDISLALMRQMNVSPTAIAIFTNRYHKAFLHHLVSSQVDCDRLDYLTRDSFFTGVSEGVIGTERILNMYSVTPKGELVIDEKGIYSIEKFIISRRLMYWQVYMHKTVVAADNLLKSIFSRVRDMLAMGLPVGQSKLNSSLLYFLKHNPQTYNEESLAYFVDLDDTDVVSAVKIWSKNDDKILKYLAQSLLDHNLGKIHFTDSLQQTPINSDWDKYCKRSAELENKAYSFNDESINIIFKSGDVKEICNASDQLDRAFLSKDIRKFFAYNLPIPD
ncbi:MAG: HD domain-containing protein [Bacteroidales bacterium]|jgi:HD superfamily phosphohydrolase|nr:HD domain-containing protein [Bacteroidales bacterium]